MLDSGIFETVVPARGPRRRKARRATRRATLTRVTARTGPKIAVVAAVMALIAGVAGLIVTLVLSAVVFDDFDAYGEIPVPGSGRVQLPAGEVTVNFHTSVTGGIDGGFPMPPLEIGIDAP